MRILQSYASPILDQVIRSGDYPHYPLITRTLVESAIAAQGWNLGRRGEM